jgi:hypothetical protein
VGYFSDEQWWTWRPLCVQSRSGQGERRKILSGCLLAADLSCWLIWEGQKLARLHFEVAHFGGRVRVMNDTESCAMHAYQPANILTTGRFPEAFDSLCNLCKTFLKERSICSTYITSCSILR